MKKNNPMDSFCLMTFIIILTGLALLRQETAYSQNQNNNIKHPQPKVITYNPDSTRYQEIFDGDKDSVIFYSGVVTIEPNKSGQAHSTDIYEEMIVVLEGEGQVKITNQKKLDLKYGNIALIPPNTKHQVFNTGTKNLKYFYVAAKSEGK